MAVAQSGRSRPRERLWTFLRVFLALLIGVEGVDLAVSSNKLVAVYPWMWGVGALMALGGLSYVALEVRDLRAAASKGVEASPPTRTRHHPPVPAPFFGEEPEGPSLAARLLGSVIGADGRRVWLLAPAGIVLILADVAYNNGVVLRADPDTLYGTTDVVALLLGALLVAYPAVPRSWAKERDFALMFSLALMVWLVLPLLVIRATSNDQQLDVDIYSSTLLAPPLAGMLNALGIYAQPRGIYLDFELAQGGIVSLGISTSCSGIYSFTIFASAFTSYVLVEFGHLRARLAGVLLLGIGAAYAANLLRMLIIVLTGYYTDTAADGLQHLLWVHANAGWVIFLGWVSLFWFLLFRYTMPAQVRKTAAAFEVVDLGQQVFCVGCGAAVDPERIPDACPTCGEPFEVRPLEEQGPSDSIQPSG